MALRDWVSKGIEELRSSGKAGSSLATEVTIWADGELFDSLKQVGDELRFLLITSEAKIEALDDAPEELERIELENGSISIRVTASEHNKCVRCWHQRADVGSSPEHPELCGRCIVNVDGPGEIRRIG